MANNTSMNPNPTSPAANQAADLSWREPRRAQRAERRAARFGPRGGAWAGGALLVLLGVVFLLQNMGAVVIGNWWALFVLLPAVGAFGAAWQSVGLDGQVSGRVIGSLVSGVILTLLTVLLFWGIDLTFIGPILLILLGIGVLAAA